MLTPLKTVAPYVITVDKATGASEITSPMSGDRQITYNEAVAKYFLADYVRNREGWIPQARQEFFEGVLAMSSRDEQARWTAFYSKDNPKSPQSVFTDLDTVFIAVKSVTFVSAKVAQIRFTKTLQRGFDRHRHARHRDRDLRHHRYAHHRTAAVQEPSRDWKCRPTAPTWR